SLGSRGQFADYLLLQKASHNTGILEQVMCREVVSGVLRGRLYDCDLNQLLGVPLQGLAWLAYLLVGVVAGRPTPVSITSMRSATNSSCISRRLLVAPRVAAASVMSVSMASTAEIMPSTSSSVVAEVSATAEPVVPVPPASIRK
ncbi:MAG: DUF3641 domain-containing protein, partial [Rhizobium sp.]|nr:DUF3641 domain-containing protein [Rhizobium sp.]